MPILYTVIQYMMWFLSGVSKVPTPNVRLDVWDCVESYMIRMLLGCRLKIIPTSNLKLIIFLFGITTSITVSLPVVIICGLNVACSISIACLLEVGHQA